MSLTVDRNLRTHREVLQPFVGKKVSLSTTEFHYVVGRLVELRPDENLRLLIGTDDQEVLVPRLSVATIHEAPAAMAEFVK